MNDLKEIYSYFSHNFRTSVATIITTIEAVKMELISMDDDEIASVYESAYILDLCDVSLTTCIDYVLNKKIPDNQNIINPCEYVKNALNEFKAYLKESEINVDLNCNDFEVKTNEFVIKNFLQLLTIENIKNTVKTMNIMAKNGKIVFKIDQDISIPYVFETLADILRECHVEFKYTVNSMELIFDENIVS